tara:strand:- start:2641 stop:3072 length:432 start_codon:yes stop_codon:yes gene_type:complete
MTIKLTGKKIPVLVIIAIVLVIGYLMLRIIFNGSTPDITLGFFAVILGFTLTSLVTFLLLNEQTDAELCKEESIQFLNLKMSAYQELLQQLYNVITKIKISKEDIIGLRLLNQHISYAASAEILQGFNSFLSSSLLFKQKRKI